MAQDLMKKFSGKTVIVTGHTGFKGSWLSAWLVLLGAKVVGIAVDPPSSPNHFDAINLGTKIEDLRIELEDLNALKRAFIAHKPDFVFHLAAQALIRDSYFDPVKTWKANVFGTINILECLRGLDSQCTAVIITSDKCYENVEWVWGYKETDKLGGADPYSSSKAAAELAISTYVRSYFPSDGNVGIASARAGNVIGGGDWGKDRIVPDCVRAWAFEKTVELRNPYATRPWQHVLEPLSGYLNLAINLNKEPGIHGEAFNFGPPSNQVHSVLELVEEMSKHWNRVQWSLVSGSKQKLHEAKLLNLNCDKSMYYLGWKAVMNFEETIEATVDWYKEYYTDPQNIFEKTCAQVQGYETLASKKGLGWAL